MIEEQVREAETGRAKNEVREVMRRARSSKSFKATLKTLALPLYKMEKPNEGFLASQ